MSSTPLTPIQTLHADECQRIHRVPAPRYAARCTAARRAAPLRRRASPAGRRWSRSASGSARSAAPRPRRRPRRRGPCATRSGTRTRTRTAKRNGRDSVAERHRLRTGEREQPGRQPTTTTGARPSAYAPGRRLFRNSAAATTPRNSPATGLRRRRQPGERRGDGRLRPALVAPPVRPAEHRGHRAQPEHHAEPERHPAGQRVAEKREHAGERAGRADCVRPGPAPAISAISPADSVPAIIIVVRTPSTDIRYGETTLYETGCIPPYQARLYAEPGCRPTNSAQASWAARSPPLFAKSATHAGAAAAADDQRSGHRMTHRAGPGRASGVSDRTASPRRPAPYRGDPARSPSGRCVGTSIRASGGTLTAPALVGPCRIHGGHCGSPRLPPKSSPIFHEPCPVFPFRHGRGQARDLSDASTRGSPTELHTARRAVGTGREQPARQR